MVQVRKRLGNSHRGHLDIIADILDTSCSRAKKTYLMYRCNLSFKQLKQYSGLLMKRGLLNMVSEVGSSSHSWFEVTDKGKEFLKAYEGLMTLMN